MPTYSVYVDDPLLIPKLDRILAARKLEGDTTTRNALIGSLIKDYVGSSVAEEVELPVVDANVKLRWFLTIPARFSWLPHNLMKIVGIKQKVGKKSSVQQELLLLAVHGFLSDPSYGDALREMLAHDSH